MSVSKEVFSQKQSRAVLATTHFPQAQSEKRIRMPETYSEQTGFAKTHKPFHQLYCFFRFIYVLT